MGASRFKSCHGKKKHQEGRRGLRREQRERGEGGRGEEGRTPPAIKSISSSWEGRITAENMFK